METALPTIFLMLQAVVFVTALFMHFAKRSAGLVSIYVFQSLVVAALVALLGFADRSWVLLGSAAAALIVKCFLMPWVVHRLIAKHDLMFTERPYLGTPAVFVSVLMLVLIARTVIAPVLTPIVSDGANLLFLLVAALFTSLLLAVASRGALPQIVGILAAENAIVAFAALINVHAELWLELAVLGDMFAWMLIGTTFVSVVTKHFGSADVSKMKQLAE